MWFEPIFLSDSLAVFEERNEAAQIFWGLAVAACGGEMRSNYFQNTAQVSEVNNLPS